jgi:hypothetical protein
VAQHEITETEYAVALAAGQLEGEGVVSQFEGLPFLRLPSADQRLASSLALCRLGSPVQQPRI